MVIQITTWSPDTCSCEVSYSWDDEEPAEDRVTTFYALHNVCPHHEHLATKSAHLSAMADRDLHSIKGQTKIRHIHTAMERNVVQHQKAIARVTRRTHRKELEALTPTIHAHNLKVKETFEDIFAEPYAHDEHIYHLLLKENQTKNQAIGHLEELHGITNDKVQWRLEGRAPDRKVVRSVPKPIDAVIHSLKVKFNVEVESLPV